MFGGWLKLQLQFGDDGVGYAFELREWIAHAEIVDGVLELGEVQMFC